MKRALFIVAGSVSLALGAVGIVLPLLPTVPLLLLSAFFYLRSSERLYAWLLNNRLFGPFIYSYVTYRAVSVRVKVATLALLWATLIASMILVPNIYVRGLLSVVGIAVSVHVLLLKTLTRKEAREVVDGGIVDRGDTDKEDRASACEDGSEKQNQA